MCARLLVKKSIANSKSLKVFALLFRQILTLILLILFPYSLPAQTIYFKKTKTKKKTNENMADAKIQYIPSHSLKLTFPFLISIIED